MRNSTPSKEDLRRRIIGCRLCPRLVEYRQSAPPRSSFAHQTYWRRPVPGFGDIDGRLLVIGLAPATNGGMRTGRIFTGDASSAFLVSALHRAGFASQPNSDSLDDGLVYRDCYLTAAVKCAPPADKPSPQEFANCSHYLDEEVHLMRNLQAVLALGALAFRAYRSHLSRMWASTRGMTFAHGVVFAFRGLPLLYASYHPSPRNTNTGKLTPEMLDNLLGRIKHELSP